MGSTRGVDMSTARARANGEHAPRSSTSYLASGAFASEQDSPRGYSQRQRRCSALWALSLRPMRWCDVRSERKQVRLRSYHGRGECGHCSVPRSSLMSAVASRIREHVLLGSVDRLEAAIQRELDRRRAPKSDSGAQRRKLQTLNTQIERASRRSLAVDDSLVADMEKQLLAFKARETFWPKASSRRHLQLVSRRLRRSQRKRGS